MQEEKKLTEADMIAKPRPLPTKDERKAQKAEAAEYDRQVGEIKEMLREFVNEKIIPSDIPVSVVLDAVPQLLTALIKVYATKSTAYTAHLKAKRAYEETSMKDLIKTDRTPDIDEEE